MKTTSKYGLYLCILIPGAVWLLVEIDVPKYKKFIPTNFAKDSVNRALIENQQIVLYNQTQSTPPTSPPRHFENHLIIQKPQKWHTVQPTAFNQQQNNINNDVTRQGDGVTMSTTEEPIMSDKHIVVILSYMRSGSTLTADILQHSPGTVYVFEPFHSVIVRTRQGKPLTYLNGTVRHLRDEDLTDEFLIAELHKWFTCRYEDLDVHSLSDNFHDQFSRSMRSLTHCLRAKRRTIKSLRECLPNAIKMCQNSRQLLFKFIRLPMGIIEDVFGEYPNLQVVHLLRDPRGILTSQIKLRKSTWPQIGNTSKLHCERVYNDLNSTVYLNNQFPERVKILLYENLAEDPLAVAQRLYKFVNHQFHDSIKRYIRKLTLEGRKNASPYGIVRSNSTQTAYSWRNSINITNAGMIDSNCRKTYEYLGYQPIQSEDDLRNHKNPSFISPSLEIVI